MFVLLIFPSVAPPSVSPSSIAKLSSLSVFCQCNKLDKAVTFVNLIGYPGEKIDQQTNKQNDNANKEYEYTKFENKLFII